MSRRVVGLHAVLELLVVRPRSVRKLFLRDSWEKNGTLREIASLAEKNRLKIEAISDRALEKWASGHQGVGAETIETPELNWQKLNGLRQSTLLALDGISDPHNLGAILRTAWLFGVSGVIAEKDRAAGLTPTVHKVACGGVEHVPVDFHASLVSPIKHLKDQEYLVFGLSEKAEKTFWDIEIPEKILWVVGSEAKGLKTATAKICDEMVAIPQVNSKASLNASVAAALVMAETQRQRRRKL